MTGAPKSCQAPDEAKRVSTLRAAAALAGYQIARTDPADGPVRYFAIRWGLVRELGGLIAAETFARAAEGD
jgi:hypothetical protein